MKKILIIFTIMAMTMVLGNAAFAQVHAVDTVLKGVNSSGVANLLNSTVTVQVVVNSPQRMTNSAVFSYYGQDTGTGYGINIFDNTAGSDSTDLTAGTQGNRFGELVQVIGTLGQYNGDIELVFTGLAASNVTTIGTGYGVKTALIPTLAAYTSFDQTLQTGGEYYEGRLVRVNNVHVSGLGTYSSISITDASGVNVLVNSACTPFFTTFTTQNPGYFAMVTAPGYTFDILGVAVQNSSNLGPYILQMRYLITDYVSTSVSVIPAAVHPGGNVNLAVSGGMPPYTFALSSYANATVTSSGVFTAGGSAASVTAIATDAIGRQGSGIVTITAVNAPLAPDVSMESMTVPRETSNVVIKP